jgi:hypothetical protein
MRRFLTILAPLLTSACICSAATPALAETVHHSNLRHVVRLNHGLTLGPAVSGWAYAPPRPPIHYHDTPSYNDPPKFGGDEALSVDPESRTIWSSRLSG